MDSIDGARSVCVVRGVRPFPAAAYRTTAPALFSGCTRCERPLRPSLLCEVARGVPVEPSHGERAQRQSTAELVVARQERGV